MPGQWTDLRRGAGRGARRPDCSHDRCGLRAARADLPSTAMAERLKAAAMAVGGRAERLQFAAAGPRRNLRSPEARAADIVVQTRCHAFEVAVATYHGCSTWLEYHRF